MPLDARYIGSTLAIPLKVKAGGGLYVLTSPTAVLRQSIYVILATRIGERLLNPEFGSRLPELLFEPNDIILATLGTQYIREALRRWEPRIEVETVTWDPPVGSQRTVRIGYVETRTRRQENQLFPWFNGQGLQYAA